MDCQYCKSVKLIHIEEGLGMHIYCLDCGKSGTIRAVKPTEASD